VALVSAGCARHEPVAARGRAVFARSCATCHALAGSGGGSVGGNLSEIRLGVGAIESFARIMPTAKPLSRADIAAVAVYIRARRRPFGS